MKNLFKSDKILESFFTRLEKDLSSDVSLKNYQSDTYAFCRWLIRSVRSAGFFAETFSETLPFLKKSLGRHYRASFPADTPPATVNRRLSSLRKLAGFLYREQLVSFNFMEGVTNITLPKKKLSHPRTKEVLSGFEDFLRQEKVSENTIKNYLSDTRHFLGWLDSQERVSRS